MYPKAACFRAVVVCIDSSDGMSLNGTISNTKVQSQKSEDKIANPTYQNSRGRGGVYDLHMGLPPGFQKATLFQLPTVAVIPTFSYDEFWLKTTHF